jgi:hypothetical protein
LGHKKKPDFNAVARYVAIGGGRGILVVGVLKKVGTGAGI